MTRRPFDPFGFWREAEEERDPIEDEPADWWADYAERKRDERECE